MQRTSFITIMTKWYPIISYNPVDFEILIGQTIIELEFLLHSHKITFKDS